jgi:asparagine synthase (glutamine-hydrolysing)
MCGIFASLGLEANKASLDVVAHRGPDGEGWVVRETPAGPLALGHRRLAIIDLSDAALQPMHYGDGRYWLVFNGEIYNYIELCEELKALGHVFRTNSDSEVLLAAYAQWGERCLPRLMGMFAFVLWDDREKTLFVARDRFGIKPLYYVALPQGLGFGSEIKQLIALPSVERRMNVARMRDFVSGGISDHTSETMFASICQLRGGECALVRLSTWRPGDDLPVRRWYEVLEPGTGEMTEAQAADRFRALLADSVRMHLRADVPVGSCLSGGLDSSSIVCLMDRELRQQGHAARINTVSACYAEKSVDERPFMDAVIAETTCDPHFVYPTVSDAFARAEDITWQQDEPYGSTSIFAQWSVFKTAREVGVKVMLDGQGADEQLAGYHGGFGFYVADLVRRGQMMDLIRTVLQRRNYHGLAVADQLKTALLPLLPGRLANLVRHQRTTLAQHDWLNSPAFASLANEPNAFDRALREIGRPTVKSIGELCVALTQGSNLPMLLHWEDRNSMAHGIEARVPFLDHRLVEFCIGLGSRHKIVHGDTKRVLRRAMTGILPESIVNRRDKLGFATPESEWFRGPARGMAIEGIEQTLSMYKDLLNPAGTRAYLMEMLDGVRPLDFTLWRVINIGIWGRLHGVSL